MRKEDEERKVYIKGRTKGERKEGDTKGSAKGGDANSKKEVNQAKMARYRHLVFPILEFLQEHQLYPDEQILKFKIELLNKTNMVDYAMDIHKSLDHTEDAPQDMEEAAALLVTFLLNPNAVQELRGDKKYNLQMLKERYQIGPDQIEALNQYAKFQFECGNYSGAADYLSSTGLFALTLREV